MSVKKPIVGAQPAEESRVAKSKTPRTADERVETMLGMMRGLSGFLYAEEGGLRAEIIARHYRAMKMELDAATQPNLPNT